MKNILLVALFVLTLSAISVFTASARDLNRQAIWSITKDRAVDVRPNDQVANDRYNTQRSFVPDESGFVDRATSFSGLYEPRG